MRLCLIIIAASVLGSINGVWGVSANPLLALAQQEHAAVKRLLSESHDGGEVLEVSKSEKKHGVSDEVKIESNSMAAGATPFASFVSSVASSVALTLFTEFGDRTFFIAALLSMKHPRTLVFIATSAALVIQTIFSTIVGQLFHFLPNNSTTATLMRVPLDDYAAALLLFVFGFIHLKAAIYEEELELDLETGYRCVNDEDCNEEERCCAKKKEEEQLRVLQGGERGEEGERDGREVDNKMTQYSSTIRKSDLVENSVSSVRDITKVIATTSFISQGERRRTSDAGSLMSEASSSYVETPSLIRNTKTAKVTQLNNNHEYNEALIATSNMPQLSSSWDILKSVFFLIFVAELGDKSMIATVALAAAQNPFGVFFGAATAHCLVTAVAVVMGGVMTTFISEKTANFIGAGLFFAFGGFTLWEGIERQMGGFVGLVGASLVRMA